GGIYAKELGALAGVDVPVVPMAHEYLVTKPAGLPRDLPTMRDPSLLVYFRPESGGLVMGGYERQPAPWSLDGIPPDFNARQLVAEWIVEGTPSLDTWEMDSRRFGRHYRSRAYTLARTLEIYQTYYDVKYPGHERQAGRPLRLSPTYPRLAELGAAFSEKSGWERANWFEPNAAQGDEALRPDGWAGRLWSPAIGAEHRACRQAAAL